MTSSRNQRTPAKISKICASCLRLNRRSATLSSNCQGAAATLSKCYTSTSDHYRTRKSARRWVCPWRVSARHEHDASKNCGRSCAAEGLSEEKFLYFCQSLSPQYSLDQKSFVISNRTRKRRCDT